MHDSFEIVIAASGSLGLYTLTSLYTQVSICGIMTDTNSFEIIKFAEYHRINCFIGNPRNGRAELFIKKYKRCFLLSINYLFIFDNTFLSYLLYAVNIHGSLLPKYRGRTPHVWAIINGETECGITAHEIVPACDAGRIIIQRRISIDPEDTGASILEKYRQAYPVIVAKLLHLLEGPGQVGTEQDETRATWFGKRMPTDGRIVWSWHRERIRNWIRAQTAPYPGAFTFRNGDKLVCWHAKISDLGFDNTMHDGFVRQVVDGRITIKTPNGCIEIDNFYLDGKNAIMEGDILE